MNGTEGAIPPEIEELLPGYVLGALDPEEQAQVERYLQGHRALVRRLQALATAVDALALSVEPMEPPAHARQALLARVHAQASTTTGQAVGASSTGDPGFSPRGTATPTVSGAQEGRPGARLRLPRGLWSGVAAISAAAALVLAFLWLQTLGQLRSQSQQVAQLESQLAEVQATLAQLEDENSLLRARLNEAEHQWARLTEPEAYIVLQGTEEAPDAEGVFYVAGDTGMLVFWGLYPPPPGKTYQLWLVPEDGQPIHAGFPHADSQGYGVVLVKVPPDVKEKLGRVGITVEPAGGSPGPTGPRVLVGFSG